MTPRYLYVHRHQFMIKDLGQSVCMHARMVLRTEKMLSHTYRKGTT